MLAMAIVALGRVRIAKLINFPMVGFKITLGYFMVALATGIDDALLETLSIRAENFMGIMAVIAHGQFAFIAGLAGEVDALTEYNIDSLVACCTRISNVGPVHTGFSIIL